MSTESARHAILLALGVFGGAAIWFTCFIVMMKRRGSPPIGTDPWEHAKYRAASRLWGAVVAIPALIYVLVLGNFW
jgi:hypothetical protein